MALTFESRTLRGRIQDVLVVADGIVIQKDALVGHDIAQLEQAQALIDGTKIVTLKDALAELTLKNGKNALEYYDSLLIDIVEANASYRPRGAALEQAVWDATRADAVDDAVTHERLVAAEQALQDAVARIAALEAIDADARITALEGSSSSSTTA